MASFIKKVYNKFFDQSFFSQKISYAQTGEDLIVDFILTWILKVENPIYLDIGANHPHAMNNTFIFYKRGCSGVNIEPDPSLLAHFKKMRPRDVNINQGVGFGKSETVADFYMMSSNTLNTFSKEEADRISNSGGATIKEVKQISLISINGVFEKYFPGKEVDFLTIDVEGLDVEILSSLDFELYQPKVICVETAEHSWGGKITKRRETTDILLNNGYSIYADTGINSIFVRSNLIH